MLVGHFIGVPGIEAARLGVELFFVLSGRLMAEILFAKQVPPAPFFARRFSRIYPALLAFVLIVSVSGFYNASAMQIAASLTFTLNYLHPYVGGTPALGHIWSLCIEEHMYIGLAIVAALHRRFGFNPALVLGLIGLAMMINGAVQTALGGDYYQVYWRTDTRGASILCGAVAYLVLEKRLWARPVHPILPILLGLAGLMLNMGFVPDPLKYTLGAAALAASLALLPHSYRFARDILENKALTTIGIMSFSTYLWQQPFYTGTIHGPFALPVAVAGTAILACMSYFLIEGPARAFLNAHLGRWLVRRSAAPAQDGVKV